MELLKETTSGLYCEAGDFFIDPWRPVKRALITHGHADHARRGCSHYLCAAPGAGILRVRLGEDISLETLSYGTQQTINGVTVSFHPAGHLLGSAQIRLEQKGHVLVVSGDYKIAKDPTCAPFEPVRCHTFISECTFGLPVYRWPAAEEVIAEINQWWGRNQERGWTSVLHAYSLGKAQRLLAAVDGGIGPILVHGSLVPINQVYRDAGISLPETQKATPEAAKEHKGRALVVAPPSAGQSSWIRKFAPYSVAMASGWMRIRGARRRRAMDRGFVLSDHVDWPGMLEAIKQSEAETFGLTHGYTAATKKYLEEVGYQCFELQTRFMGESENDYQDLEGSFDE